MADSALLQYGPWERAIDWCERLARLRSMRALVHAFFGADHRLNHALAVAESEHPDDLDTALAEMERIPSRDRRKILSTYNAMLAVKIAAKAQIDARKATEMGRRASV